MMALIEEYIKRGGHLTMSPMEKMEREDSLYSYLLKLKKNL